MKCIKCGGKTQKYGKVNSEQRYNCLDCNKTFTENSLKKELERKEKYDKIKKMYLDENLSTIEIGRILGVSSTVPQRIIKKMGISKTISEAKKNKKIGSKLPKKEIVEKYLDGYSSIKIAEELNISKTSVLNTLNGENINRDNIYEYEHPKIVKIEELYLSGLSMNQISKTLGISYTAINNNLHKLGIVRTEDKYRIGMDYQKYIKELPVYKKYISDVMKVTNKQKIENLPNFNKKRGLCGVDGAYQLDHKFSILEGFKEGLSPKIIGNINNLEFISWEENLKKGSNCSITINELRNRVKTAQ
jgi:transposase-like protein